MDNLGCCHLRQANVTQRLPFCNVSKVSLSTSFAAYTQSTLASGYDELELAKQDFIKEHLQRYFPNGTLHRDTRQYRFVENNQRHEWVRQTDVRNVQTTTTTANIMKCLCRKSQRHLIVRTNCLMARFVYCLKC